MWGILPFLIFVVLRLYVTALERPIWGVIVTIIGVGFNIIADWLLIFGPGPFPELGLEGAAIASLMSNTVLMLGMIFVTTGLKPFRRYRLLANFWRSDWPRLWHITKLGVPIAIMLTLEVTIFSAAIFLMGLIDRESVAAHAIALQIAAVAFMIPLGLSQAATVRVGYYYGREDREGIRLAGLVAYGLGVGAAVLLALIMIVIPGPLVGLFMEEGVGPGSRVFDLAVSSCSSPRCSSWPTVSRRWVPACCAGYRIRAGRCSMPVLAIGSSVSALPSALAFMQAMTVSASGSALLLALALLQYC